MTRPLRTEDVAALFAAGLAPAAASADGKVWFANRVIYSVGIQFPMAVWADDMPGTVYFTRATYSVMTAQHKNTLFRTLKAAGVDVVVVECVKALAYQARAASHRPVTSRREIFAA